MTVKEIRESGLLEYYVLGLLSKEEILRVEGYLVQFPELRRDHLEIQRSVQSYAKSQGVIPKRNLENEIADLIRKEGSKIKVEPKLTKKPSSSSNPTHGTKSGGNGWLGNMGIILLAGLTLFSGWWAWDKSNKFDDLQSDYAVFQAECDSLDIIQNNKIQLYESLNSRSNQAFEITPTDNYSETNLLFHFNPVLKQNFIQIRNMPAIASNQAFQLWSLKDGVDPIPLTVFNSEGDVIIPVDFEDGTGTYAITIEDENGAQSPTLTRLIGTITVA